jgi:hypothetical protein
MACVSSWVRGSACALALMGCGREAIVAAGACEDHSPGDLVITEVHANPDGSDGDGEYIELFNATGSSLDLDGLTLEAGPEDGTNTKSHRFVDLSVDAENYIVVGNASAQSMPEHVRCSYGNALGSLRNSDGALSIRCGDMVIDQVRYERTFDGRALELDGRFAPDHELNDDLNHWCATPEGVDEVWNGNFGTPGSSNSPCKVEMPVEGLCLDAGAGRPIRVPAPGNVRITEWMANPAGADADFEWVEARFDAATDLNGFQLGPAPDALKAVIDQEDCFRVDAGTWVVFGASSAAAPRVDADLGFNLGNSGPRSIMAAVDGAVLDRVDYDDAIEGVAWQVDPRDAVCPALAEDEYLEANFGTPGRANPRCPAALGPGMCLDAGVARHIVSPGPDDVTIMEWMANPSAVGNREGEWVEVRFDTAVDLNGVALSDLASSTTTVEDEDCLPVGPGAYVVFARNERPAENGGIDDVDVQMSLSLNNSDETITLSAGGRVLDSMTYSRSKPGVATQVDETGQVCDAVSAYGDGDLGTPGSANPWCF